MNTHLNERERESGNKRNGKGSKRLKTMSGEVVITTPEDRKSSFSPQIVKKREIVLADNLALQIIVLYSTRVRVFGIHPITSSKCMMLKDSINKSEKLPKRKGHFLMIWLY